MKVVSLVLVLIINLWFSAFSQSKEELERQKRENAEKIRYTNELLKKTERNKKDTYNQLLLLRNKIDTRLELIDNIESEITYLNNQIEIHQDIISSLEGDLKSIKEEYAKIIYNSYKHRNSYEKIMFILASESMNKAFKRVKYLQQYSKYRKNQVKQLKETKENINNEIVQLEIIKAEKKDLLIEKRIENRKLETEKNQQNLVINKLSNKEKELKTQLQKQYDLSQRLQKEIERIIEEEARKAAERAKNKNSEYFQLTPEEKLLADIFIKNKTRLPWPTERGVITSDFGEHPHPVIRGVKIRNDGIDITTNENAVVRAIYDGVVSSVFVIPGAHKTVIIRHGNYLSVYSNLKDVVVKQGDKVNTKQTIGTVYTESDEGNKSVLKFQIWREKEKMDPQEWLAKGRNG